MTTRREKTIAGVLVFFAALTLILGFVQIQKTLRATLLFDPPKQKEGQTVSSNRLGAGIDPSKDTDGDGLPDTDELNRYGTSPYLADSDSDGVNDQQEIKNGTDPNCPEGKQCGLAASRSTLSGKPRTISDILEREMIIPPVQDLTPSTETPQTSSAAQLRAALLATGVPKEQLDQIDDARLLEMYRETERDVQKKEQPTPPDTGATGMQKLTGAQIRALLKAQGMTDAELTQIDDATLEQLFLEGARQKFQNNGN